MVTAVQRMLHQGCCSRRGGADGRVAGQHEESRGAGEDDQHPGADGLGPPVSARHLRERRPYRPPQRCLPQVSHRLRPALSAVFDRGRRVWSGTIFGRGGRLKRSSPDAGPVDPVLTWEYVENVLQSGSDSLALRVCGTDAGVAVVAAGRSGRTRCG
eukprot:1137832-Rhodomonas_salina.2